MQDRRAEGLLLPTFLAAVFLSAGLIFAIQPMFTRFVLPQLGGSPAVWSVAMAFFQSVLFAGYLYAHGLSRIGSARVVVAIHLAISALAVMWLPLGVVRGWGEAPAEGESLWLVGLFAVSVGLPYFALSANGPLLQSWFARAAGAGRDPYFLYAVSNAGSFLALLAYPLVMEPLLSLDGQSRLWSAGFLVLVVLLSMCGWLVVVRSDAPPGALAGDASAAEAPVRAEEPAPSAADLARWCLLSAVPSGLLVAVTAQISTDIAAIPLVWVIPLALYLMTLVVVFRSWGATMHGRVLALTPWALLLLAADLTLMAESNLTGVRFLLVLGLHLLVFVVVAFMCHGELARTRPAPRHLTLFYLMMSLGGMIGGVMAGMIAPRLFSWVAEYPILLVAAALCRPMQGRWRRPLLQPRHMTAIGIAVLVLLPGLAGATGGSGVLALGILVPAAALIAGALVWRNVGLLALALAVALLATRVYPPEGKTALTFRSFFGVHKIHESEDGRHRLLLHGTTIHGAQAIRDAEGKPLAGRPEPLTYYHRNSPIAEALAAARMRKGGALRIGAVGLGAGSMACLVEPADHLTYYEIDPTVIAIARNPRWFTFLSACKPDAPIVVGDARLTLTRAPDAGYDVIVIDAFSSDSIPAHLLTREAMALYASKLTPAGLLVMHVSNRHMELVSVAHSVAKAAGLVSLDKDEELPDEAEADYKFDSTVVIASRAKESLVRFAGDRTWYEPSDEELSVRAWTDDYANPLGAIWRKLWE